MSPENLRSDDLMTRILLQEQRLRKQAEESTGDEEKSDARARKHERELDRKVQGEVEKLRKLCMRLHREHNVALAAVPVTRIPELALQVEQTLSNAAVPPISFDAEQRVPSVITKKDLAGMTEDELLKRTEEWNTAFQAWAQHSEAAILATNQFSEDYSRLRKEAVDANLALWVEYLKDVEAVLKPN